MLFYVGVDLPNPFNRTTRSLAADNASFAIFSWSLAGFLLSVWMYWFFFSAVTLYEISHKARLEVNYSAHPLVSLVAGKLISIQVGLDEQVAAGQVLFTLDSHQQQLALAAEKSRLDALPTQIDLLVHQIASLEQVRLKDSQAAQAAMDSLRSKQKGAGAAEAFAEDYASRLEQLSRSGKSAVVESLRAKAESARLNSARQSISADLQRLQIETVSQAHQVQAEVDNLKRELAKLQGDQGTLENNIAKLQQEIDQHTIRSPATGKVGDLAQLQIGSYVEIGANLGSVVPSSELRIVADFPPAAAVGRIQIDQLGEMRLDGFPWAQFGTVKARVRRVGSEIRDNHIRVELIPESNPDSLISLQHGLPGSIEIAIEQVSPALLVLRKSGQLIASTRSANQSNFELKN